MSIITNFLFQNFDTIFYSFLGGILPALLWLWFWLREDIHPEPKKMIFFTFMAGAAAIPFVFVVEYGFLKLFLKLKLIASVNDTSFILLFLLAGTEEYFKYSAAKYSALRTKYYDEPADALIYLITAALGFAAIENTFYLFQSIASQGTSAGFFSNNLRFLGANLIHVVSSGFLGASIGFSFSNKKYAKIKFILGFLLAVSLHALFNYFIIESGKNIFKVFLAVWVLAAIIIYIFERIKKQN